MKLDHVEEILVGHFQSFPGAQRGVTKGEKPRRWIRNGGWASSSALSQGKRITTSQSVEGWANYISEERWFEKLDRLPLVDPEGLEIIKRRGRFRSPALFNFPPDLWDMDPAEDPLYSVLPLSNWWARHRGALTSGVSVVLEDRANGVGSRALLELTRKVIFALQSPAHTVSCVDFDDLPSPQSPAFQSPLLVIHNVHLGAGPMVVKQLATAIGGRSRKGLVSFVHFNSEVSPYFEPYLDRLRMLSVKVSEGAEDLELGGTGCDW